MLKMTQAKNRRSSTRSTTATATRTRQKSGNGTARIAVQTTRSRKPAKTQTIARNEPSYETIAGRAYEIWQRKGCPTGQDTENWLQARAELVTS